MYKKGFEGWYFKHQFENRTLAFIPGRSESGCFIQMIDEFGSRQFDVPSLEVRNGVIYAGNCRFSKSGIVIDLPNVKGKIRYGMLYSLKSDIMGPFRFFPMECRHGVISMSHTLKGAITVDGEKRVFDNGIGYIEKDSGTSFPSSYLWLQCNNFSEPCSIMVSIAHIPFAGISFKGCICAIVYQGIEYRIATYKGVKICSEGPQFICLTQGKLKLEISIEKIDTGFELSSPIQGIMSGMIRENISTKIHATLWNYNKKVFDFYSSNATFEYVK